MKKNCTLPIGHCKSQIGSRCGAICNLQFAIGNDQSAFLRGALPCGSRLNRRGTAPCPDRAGSALIVVLVLIVLLSLAAYTFSETMIVENEASEFASRQAQARAYAESGVEYAAAVLGSLPEEGVIVNLYHEPSQYAAVLVQDAGTPRTRGRFTFVAPVETDAASQRVRSGLMDESAKLNVNTVLSYELEEEEVRAMFANIPGMTDEVIDGILDWIDDDDESRSYGAESDLYETLAPPYAARNGEIESLDELLLVSGVTPQLLYGEDANRNGLLDPNEDDADASLPVDNADGILDPGWSAFLTVYSRESNLRLDGTDKIDVNQSLLADLYDQLAEEMDEEAALFITAYRLYGATNVEPLDEEAAGLNTTGDQSTDEQLQDVAQGVGRAIAGGEGTITRGGLDLTKSPEVEIESLYELIDAEVEAEIDGEETTLTSPWTSDPGSLVESLPLLFGTLTTTPSQFIEGRININQARREVLLGIPGMEPDVADGIVASQLIGDDGSPMTSQLEMRQTAGWLLIQGMADVTMMRRLDPYVTGAGDVYRVQVLGHFDQGGPIVRVEAVIDRSEFPPRILGRRDLSNLGPGYLPEWLAPGGASSAGGGLQ
jgi:DNA uptake protein ComE-like DNA-binding protein